MRSSILVAGATTLAAATGVLGALALGASSQEPTSTTTLNVATGAQGEPGPPGPPGPAGEVNCGTGFHTGLVVINHPGGQITVKTCVKN